MAKKKDNDHHPDLVAPYDRVAERKKWAAEDKAAAEKAAKFTAHPDAIVIYDEDGKPVHNKALDKKWEKMAAEEAKAEAAVEQTKGKAEG